LPLILAAFASVTFGVADFVGGFAARRTPAVTVVAGSHVIALGAIFAVGPLFGEGFPPASDLAWGFAGGMAGSVGLAVFYHALATTRIGVAAPVASVVSTLVPVVFGIVTGERPGAIAWVGMLLAIPAMLLLPATGRALSADPSGLKGHRAAVLGAIAGVGFGLFGIFISLTRAESGLWPLAGARFGSLALMAVVVAVMKVPFLPGKAAWRAVAGAGILDMAANVLFLLAVRRELLSLVAVIMSFYPASTIALARVVLGERTVPRQLLGLGLAVAAVTLIAVA
jgi:drug/metabolite transporter (DMT)-like permease